MMSHCSHNTEHTVEYNSKDECGQNDRSAVTSSTVSLCSHSSEMQLRTARSDAFLGISLIWIFWIATASSQDWRKFVPMSAYDPQQNRALIRH
jgi:hypothetical protein